MLTHISSFGKKKEVDENQQQQQQDQDLRDQPTTSEYHESLEKVYE